MVRAVDPTPVFVCGEMRSGTNMLTNCLDSCWQTAAFNESDDDAFTGYALKSDEVISGLVKKSKASHVVFKSIADSSRADELIELFPSAKIVWIFRDYQDVVNSAMKKWTEHNKYLSYVLHEPEKAGWRSQNLPESLLQMIRLHFDRGISDTSARALIWYVRNSMFFEQELARYENVLLVRYEKLAREPGHEFERIFRFLKLPLRNLYYDRVSTRSIRRDSTPQIDDTIREICDQLQAKLISQLESGMSA